jgi:predicted nucleic acid binding AN1-type Zn finger protein
MKRIQKRKLPKLPLRKSLLRKGSITKKEYKQLKKSKFKLKPFLLKDKKFSVEIIRKIKLKEGGVRGIQINADEFIKSKDYEIYIKHRPTRQRRLLAIGKLQDIPINTKQSERFGQQLAGRTFDASKKYPKRAKGKWVPVNRIVRGIQKELEERGMEFKTEVRASIIPLKRYFHSKWKVYSDEPVSGRKKYRAIFVHCAVRFTYPNQDWIGKQSILLDFESEKIPLNQLYRRIPEIEDMLNFRLELLHPQAENVSLIEVNGFIPLY